MVNLSYPILSIILADHVKELVSGTIHYGSYTLHLSGYILRSSDDSPQSCTVNDTDVNSTLVNQSMQSKGYVECDMDGEEGGKKELGELRRNGTGD